MNKPGQKPPSTELKFLMPESCFIDLQTFNSPQVVDHIEDKELHAKTMNTMLKNALQEKIKEKRNKK